MSGNIFSKISRPFTRAVPSKAVSSDPLMANLTWFNGYVRYSRSPDGCRIRFALEFRSFKDPLKTFSKVFVYHTNGYPIEILFSRFGQLSDLLHL